MSEPVAVEINETIFPEEPPPVKAICEEESESTQSVHVIHGFQEQENEDIDADEVFDKMPDVNLIDEKPAFGEPLESQVIVPIGAGFVSDCLKVIRIEGSETETEIEDEKVGVVANENILDSNKLLEEQKNSSNGVPLVLIKIPRSVSIEKNGIHTYKESALLITYENGDLSADIVPLADLYTDYSDFGNLQMFNYDPGGYCDPNRGWVVIHTLSNPLNTQSYYIQSGKLTAGVTHFRFNLLLLFSYLKLFFLEMSFLRVGWTPILQTPRAEVPCIRQH